MITEVPLQDSRDGGHGERDERTLLGSEALGSLNQACAGDLQQVLLVLPAVKKAPRQRLGEPEVRGDHLIDDLLALVFTDLTGPAQQGDGTVSELLSLRLLWGLCVLISTVGQHGRGNGGMENNLR